MAVSDVVVAEAGGLPPWARLLQALTQAKVQFMQVFTVGQSAVDAGV